MKRLSERRSPFAPRANTFSPVIGGMIAMNSRRMPNGETSPLPLSLSLSLSLSLVLQFVSFSAKPQKSPAFDVRLREDSDRGNTRHEARDAIGAERSELLQRKCNLAAFEKHRNDP